MNRSLRSLVAAAGLAVSAMLAAPAHAAPVSTAFTYQGQMKDGGGLANANYDFAFVLFNAAAGGSQVGLTQTVNGVAVADGLFMVSLDFGEQFDGTALWLEVRVKPAGGGVYQILTPRQALTGAPYAQGVQLPLTEAGNASGGLLTFTNSNSTPGSAHVLKLVSGAPSGNTLGIFYQPGLLVDTNSGNGIASAVSSSGGYAFYAKNEGSSGYCFVGQNSSAGGGGISISMPNAANTGDAVAATTAGTGDAVNGSTTGTGHAGSFTLTNTGSAATALLASTNGTGRAGQFTSTNTAATVPTLSATNAATGDSIPNGSQDNGIAIKGQATGGFGIGVMGRGVEAGVFGYSGTTGGAGVWGSTGGGGGDVSTGVRGDGNGAGTSGVAAFNNLGNAVYAQTSSGAAIFASNGGGSGFAGDFNGKVRITGTLQVTSTVSKGGGSFQIDHPLDPDNKYLYHSFVESPDMKNIYDGLVTLDSKGEATVGMPDWFQALNQDFRYQLTCVGGYAQVFVAEEMHGNTFKIAGGKPGLKVSWQVTGTRQDAYAKIHRIPVEEVKSDADKGKYLCPEGFGKPESQRIGSGNAFEKKMQSLHN